MLFSLFLSFSVLYVPVHVHFLKLKVKEVKETGAKTECLGQRGNTVLDSNRRVLKHVNLFY